LTFKDILIVKMWPIITIARFLDGWTVYFVEGRLFKTVIHYEGKNAPRTPLE
jgi:hypothetical protein